MQELSMHLLDIAQNSVKAGATLITIEINEDTRGNLLTAQVADNGCGMTEDALEAVTNPFYTTRTTRKVGLGVPLFKMAAELTGGSFIIQSRAGEGTELTARFVYDHIDRMPLGDMAGTVSSLIQCNPDIDFIYRHRYNGRAYAMDTREFRRVLGDVPLDSPEVVLFVKDYVVEHDEAIIKGRKVDEG